MVGIYFSFGHRRFGKIKWPFSESKSVVGSLAFVVSAFAVTSGLLMWLNYWGCLAFDIQTQWLTIADISVICAAVELVPLGDDNVTVPLAATILAMLLLSN